MSLLKRLYDVRFDTKKIREILIENSISRAVCSQLSNFFNLYLIQMKGISLFSKENREALINYSAYMDLGMDLYGVEGGFVRNFPKLIKLTFPYYLPAIGARIAEEAVSKISKKDIRGVFSIILTDVPSFLAFFSMFKHTLPYASVAYTEYLMSPESLKPPIAFWGIASSALTLATGSFLLYSSLKQYTSPEFTEKFKNLGSLLAPENISKYIKKLKP